MFIIAIALILISDFLIGLLWFHFNLLYFIQLAILTNTLYVILILQIIKYRNKTINLNEEVNSVRKELKETLQEVGEYVRTLEKNNEKIKELEDENISDEQQINEILSELSLYTNQLESIVNTIDSGICTIDSNYVIQADFNKKFMDIFGSRDYWEHSILDTIFYNLDADTKKELRDFIDLCFSNATTSDSMLDAANPIHEFTYIYNENGKVVEKIVKSKVSRIFNENKEIVRLMFIFDDITVQKALEDEIKQKEEKYENELNLLTTIFQHDRDIVISFMNDLNERIKKVKEIIDALEINKPNEESLKNLQRILHSIKGEAFTLGFDLLAKQCSETEDYLKQNIQNQINVEQNLILIEHYNKIQTIVDELNEVNSKLFSFTKDGEKFESNDIVIDRESFNTFKSKFEEIINLHGKNSLNEETLENFFKDMVKLDWVSTNSLKNIINTVVEKTALNYDNKEVKLNFIYDIDKLPSTKFKIIKESLLHLVRNSISHGIEDKEERIKKEKEESGKINIHIYEEGNNYVIRYSDDGRGIDTDKIKTKSIEQGLISEEEASEMKENEILELIFRDGFSSKDASDMVAGRGVGMSVVKNNVKNLLHGNLKVINKPGSGITIIITFPK